jgi:F-type H+-transporting ATPase subunit b
MMKKRYMILLLVLPIFLFGSTTDAAEHGTDIIPRTINFIIFAAIIYYLAAKPIKDFFVGRSNSIADRLNSIQEKLKASKKEKEDARELVAKARVMAKGMIETIKQEIELQKTKMSEDLKIELKNLDKNFNDHCEIEKRKMTREVIAEVLDEVFTKGNLALEKDELLDIVLKKVA